MHITPNNSILYGFPTRFSHRHVITCPGRSSQSQSATWRFSSRHRCQGGGAGEGGLCPGGGLGWGCGWGRSDREPETEELQPGVFSRRWGGSVLRPTGEEDPAVGFQGTYLPYITLNYYYPILPYLLYIITITLCHNPICSLLYPVLPYITPHPNST